MKKADIFVKGDIICQGDFSAKYPFSVEANADPEEYDLTDAIIIDGPLNATNINVGTRSIAATGSITAMGLNDDMIRIGTATLRFEK